MIAIPRKCPGQIAESSLPITLLTNNGTRGRYLLGARPGTDREPLAISRNNSAGTRNNRY